MANSHEILIYEEPLGVGLEVRPPLSNIELHLLERNASLGRVLHNFSTTDEATFWGECLNHESQVPAARLRVENIAQKIMTVLESRGIGAQLDHQTRQAKKAPGRPRATNTTYSA